MDFAFNLMPNQPEINTNILTQHIHADSNKVRKNSAVGAHKILSLLGGQKRQSSHVAKAPLLLLLFSAVLCLNFSLGFLI